METIDALRKRIRVATGEIKADFAIRNCKIVNVHTHEIVDGDIAFSDGKIAGIGHYSGIREINAGGRYALPGLIDSHIHIESSMTSPEEFCRMLVPHGTTTVIADPHEIVNVCGMTGLRYMIDAAKSVPMDIRYMMPSCVPATAFEDSGAVVTAEDMMPYLEDGSVLGLGEFMNAVGVIEGAQTCVDKLQAANQKGMPIDGHAPGLKGTRLQAYAASGVLTDHECTTVEEMEDRLRAGMYVQLRNGSATRNLVTLAQGVTEGNAKRCLLCSDDRQPVSIFTEGDIDGMLKICVDMGIDPITAVQMGSLNAAECYGLRDRGAIAPGLKGDVVLVEDLEDFRVTETIIDGKLVAKNGEFLPKIERTSIAPVKGSVHIHNITADTFRLQLRSNKVNVIDMVPHEIITKKGVADVVLTADGDYVFRDEDNICKISVVERHTGDRGSSTALIRGYGLHSGAIATTIAHDCHNIIVVGTNNEDMALAVNTLAEIEGGIVLVKDGEVIDRMALPIAGLMSDQSGEWVDEHLGHLHNQACDVLGVNIVHDPIMTMAFMALPVIPEIKITNRGLFDVTTWQFIALEADA